MLYFSIFLILLSGFINGSFVIPGKFIKNLSFNLIWFFHSVIGLIVVPWAIMFFLTPIKFQIYSYLTFQEWLLLFFGGVIFGIGQICFFKSIQKIGIAKSFAVNLSIGVIIGTMYVVLNQNRLFSYQGSIISLSVILIVFGLIFNYLSGVKKEKTENSIGWLFVSFAGVASGIQNIVFYNLILIHINNLSESHSLFWIWPPFLFFAAMPMLIYFFTKKDLFGLKQTKQSTHAWNFSLIILMGICFTGSLYFYSKGMGLLSLTQKSIGWPLLMISIIIASQLWGVFLGEHKNEIRIYKRVSIFFLLSAIIILSTTY